MARLGRAYPPPLVKRKRPLFLLDEFKGAGDVVLASHVGEIGATWTAASGSTGVPDVFGDRLYPGSADGMYAASGVPPTANYTVYAIITVYSVLGYMGVLARNTNDGSSYYNCYIYSDGKLYLDQGAVGTDVNLGVTAALSPVVGSQNLLYIRVNGTAISGGWIPLNGGGASGVIAPVTNAVYSAKGFAGIDEGGSASPWTSVGYHMERIWAS